MNKKKLNEDFGILSNEELQQANDISAALALINKENIVTDVEPLEAKKFIVEKNKDIQALSSKASFEEKNEFELDEIANQADQAFYDLMDIALNTQGKGCGDIASSAQNFLNIKLNARLAKTEAKFKKMNYELQVMKLEASKKKVDDASDDDDDDVVIIEQK